MTPEVLEPVERILDAPAQLIDPRLHATSVLRYLVRRTWNLLSFRALQDLAARPQRKSFRHDRYTESRAFFEAVKARGRPIYAILLSFELDRAMQRPVSPAST
jgi:hypothetical protein